MHDDWAHMGILCVLTKLRGCIYIHTYMIHLYKFISKCSILKYTIHTPYIYQIHFTQTKAVHEFVNVYLTAGYMNTSTFCMYHTHIKNKRVYSIHILYPH